MHEVEDQSRGPNRRRQVFVRFSLRRSRARWPRPVPRSLQGPTTSPTTGRAWPSSSPPRRRSCCRGGGFPRWAILVPNLLYLASVCLLLISRGADPGVQSTVGGLSALVCCRLAVSLYYPSWSAVVVIAASMVASRWQAPSSQSSEATNLRRLILWTAVSVVVSVTIHRFTRQASRARLGIRPSSLASAAS